MKVKCPKMKGLWRQEINLLYTSYSIFWFDLFVAGRKMWHNASIDLFKVVLKATIISHTFTGIQTKSVAFVWSQVTFKVILTELYSTRVIAFRLTIELPFLVTHRAAAPLALFPLHFEKCQWQFQHPCTLDIFSPLEPLTTWHFDTAAESQWLCLNLTVMSVSSCFPTSPSSLALALKILRSV